MFSKGSSLPALLPTPMPSKLMPSKLTPSGMEMVRPDVAHSAAFARHGMNFSQSAHVSQLFPEAVTGEPEAQIVHSAPHCAASALRHISGHSWAPRGARLAHDATA